MKPSNVLVGFCLCCLLGCAETPNTGGKTGRQFDKIQTIGGEEMVCRYEVVSVDFWTAEPEMTKLIGCRPVPMPETP